MKELEKYEPEVVEMHAQAEENKTVFKETIILHRGHSIWELDMTERPYMIRRAKFAEDVAVIGAVGGELTGVRKRKLVMKEGCRYVAALNQHTADQKFMKLLGVTPPGHRQVKATNVTAKKKKRRKH